MGAAQSGEPRSVSLDNPSSVIDVSDEVVQRLKKGITKQVRDNAIAAHEAASASSPPPAAAPKQETRAVPVKPAPASAAPAAASRPPTVIYQNPTPLYVPPSGPTMTALDMRRQKEAELTQNDNMWRQRMTQLETTLKKTNSIMETEYSTAVEDVRKRFATASPAHQLPPSQDLKNQVIACYRENPGETLKCAEEVAMFRNSVSEHRIKKLDAEAVAPKAVKAA